MTPPTPPVNPSSATRPNLRRKHVLMLALALEVLWFGCRGAASYEPPGITVDWPSADSHRIA